MEPSGLRRQLGLFDAVMLIAGNIIGIGIFVTTGEIAQSLPTPGGILLIWLLGGCLALAGALSCAELAASLPYSGGDYIYLREAYGSLVGFLSGWSSFLVTFSGSIALLAVVFTAFLAFFFPILSAEHVLFSVDFLGLSLTLSLAHFFSMAVVLVLSAIHFVGVGMGAMVQNILTLLKIGALLGIILLGILLGNGDLDHFSPFFELERMSDLSLIGFAFIPVIFTYAGWNAVIYMAGEVREPERNLPRALLWANLLVVVLYIAINAVYFYAVPVEKMQGTIRVSELATTALFGRRTSAWITAIITVSILGSLNVTVMIGPRIYYAMAKDGLFFQGLTRVHPRFSTPSSAIVLQALWSCVLILTGTFHFLLNYVSVIITVFSGLTVGALLVLRTKRPELKRPYKIWGYPLVPVLFILVILGIALATLKEKPMDALRGLGIVALGVPAYFFWSRSRS
ncbi:MAG: amino acid permease [Deltaproteobacteria bacterium]|nr:amino acid permease [Deltaproteobacteria bacterium]